MHAVVGLPIDEVEGIVSQVQTEGIVSVANHNSELQIVITGSPGPVEKVAMLAAQKGAKSIPLKVSGAWHSRLMEGAVDDKPCSFRHHRRLRYLQHGDLASAVYERSTLSRERSNRGTQGRY